MACQWHGSPLRRSQWCSLCSQHCNAPHLTPTIRRGGLLGTGARQFESQGPRDGVSRLTFLQCGGTATTRCITPCPCICCGPLNKHSCKKKNERSTTVQESNATRSTVCPLPLTACSLQVRCGTLETIVFVVVVVVASVVLVVPVCVFLVVVVAVVVFVVVVMCLCRMSTLGIIADVWPSIIRPTVGAAWRQAPPT